MTFSTSHGGILLPLDAFRPTMLAAVLAEGLSGKARNIVDAHLTLRRHPHTDLLLGTIRGTVVGDDAAAFWRDNADLAVMASHVVPRQVFLYYVHPGPGAARSEGFVVAQRGQVLAADDASGATVPPDTPDDEWPVHRLCAQIQLDVAELAGGFAGGPHVELSLIEPSGDDRALLQTLAGAAGDGDAAAESTPPDAAPSKPDDDAKPSAEDDLKRRAKEQAEEQAERHRRAGEVTSGLSYATDDLGIVVWPAAELAETDVLEPLIVPKLEGDLPAGLPPQLASELRGKRVDIAVAVEFLSEVLVDNTPLSRPAFEDRAQETPFADTTAEVLEVLAPRLGHGTLIRVGSAKAFVSRRPGLALPEHFLLERMSS